MGQILFILGVMFIVGGLGFGLPAMWRSPESMGMALGILIPAAVVGLGGCIAGLMMGKSKPAPAPALPPSVPQAPPPEPAGLTCPQCNRKIAPGENRCFFCHPVQAAAPPPPPPPPPPMAPAMPQPLQAGPATKGRGAVRGPNGFFQVLSGPATGRQMPIAPDQQVSIGRAEDNVLMIPDPDVSGRHGVLTFANDRVMFQDLGSSNGSFLNGQPFRQGYINSGDQLQLGRTTTIYFSFK